MTVFQILILSLAAAVPGHAAFESLPAGARAGGAAGALGPFSEDLAAAVSNPAGLGWVPGLQVGLHYSRTFQVTQGNVDLDHVSFSAGAPLRGGPWTGALALGWFSTQSEEAFRERSFQLAYGVRDVWVRGGARLGAGAALRYLRRTPLSGSDSASGIGGDVGAIFRAGSRAVSLSILNVNQPGLDLPQGPGTAPLTLKLGYGEVLRKMHLGVEAASIQPSGTLPASLSLAAGLERSWAFYRWGSVAARTGLSLGERTGFWSLGAGWRILGAQLDYALYLPRTSRSRASHFVSLGLRFGEADPEEEYQRLLANEIRYRQELSQALEASQVGLWKQTEELNQLRQDVDALKDQLRSKGEEAVEARGRVKDMEARERQAQWRLKTLAQEQARIRARSRESLYREDWANYSKLKAQGAPDALLVDALKRILRRHQESGLDLGEPNQELLRLLRNR